MPAKRPVPKTAAKAKPSPPSPKSAGEVHVALLRGINVGGKNPLPMADLVAVFEAAGCRDVRTYIQSGNVLFRASTATRKGLAQAVTSAIERRLGLAIPVVLRSAQELRTAERTNPYARKAGADEDALHVMFLADAPAKAAVAGLDPRRSPPDEFTVVGRDVFLRCPNGMARTKLTNAYFDSKLATVSTVRNWRTLRKLIELAGA